MMLGMADWTQGRRPQEAGRMRYISRNPFARQETHRITIATADRGKCPWCGQPARYRYVVHSDGGRTMEDRRTFCSIECRRSYQS